LLEGVAQSREWDEFAIIVVRETKVIYPSHGKYSPDCKVDGLHAPEKEGPLRNGVT